jgi:hypothetical protein
LNFWLACQDIKCNFFKVYFINEKNEKIMIFQRTKKQEFYFHKVFKILGAKNRRKTPHNQHKHLGPTFEIRPGLGCFSRAKHFLKGKMQ